MSAIRAVLDAFWSSWDGPPRDARPLAWPRRLRRAALRALFTAPLVFLLLAAIGLRPAALLGPTLTIAAAVGAGGLLEQWAGARSRGYGDLAAALAATLVGAVAFALAHVQYGYGSALAPGAPLELALAAAVRTAGRLRPEDLWFSILFGQGLGGLLLLRLRRPWVAVAWLNLGGPVWFFPLLALDFAYAAGDVAEARWWAVAPEELAVS